MNTTCPQCFGNHGPGACPGALPPPSQRAGQNNPDLPAGTAVGEYVIEAKIGDGGFGTVYRANHPVIGKPAAVKVLSHQYSANPEMVHRFVSEARAVNKIRHKNIIDIFSFGQLPDGRRFYVMELLEGRSLDEFLTHSGACEPSVALPILRGIAHALEAAHACNVVHRDLKPENVYLVRGEDGSLQVKLLDFGIAKLQSGMTSATRTGTAMGTPHYMSPEQWRGRNVDARTDVYAFGAVAYRMLTGSLPYDAPDVMEIMVLQSMNPAKPASEVNPRLPASFDEPIARMLERNVDARSKSALLAFEALERAMGNAPRAPTPDYEALSERAINRLHVSLAPTHALERPATTTAPASVPAQTRPDAAPPPRSRALLAFGAITALTAAAVATVLLTRGHAPPAIANAPAPLATSAALGVAPPPPAPPPSAPIVAEAATVSVLVTATPATADVYLGSERLGAAPGPVTAKKGGGTLTLTVKSPGYQPEDVQVFADRDSSVTVKLRPAAAAPTPPPAPRPPVPAKPGKDALETF